ncbi:diguanylate cyclase [Curvibacter sp. APW13]|uniref:diguanylate cyclase domain-containing protein n=1 Tax=Curvibacter sp. APW13 TaxID=3077236 RepID=UPI0028DD61F3|nr:diguanylate cyclase [Curvibacter sp. APW13]MDT8989411.1 diguanylate cyclase [Curvibacter sp. APW13]
MLPHTDTDRKTRILLVDDERINLMALTALLRDEFELLIATNGAQGLRLAAEQQPDLILLDVVMPDMDGHEVCRRLKLAPATQGIPVIFITARSEVHDEAQGFVLGAVDYITKPFNELIVTARVRTHARMRRQSQLLESMAMLDSLTGIPNRRAFDQVCEREWSRCRRAQTPMALLMLDVDMFKQYNDHYGHGPGDSCLVRVGRALAGCARRPGDFVGRYGGEEFVALLSDADAQAAAKQASRFLSAVAALQIPHALSRAAPVVTVSIGAATTTPRSDSGIETLKQAADQMLYAAKDEGRNRFKLSTVVGEP